MNDLFEEYKKSLGHRSYDALSREEEQVLLIRLRRNPHDCDAFQRLTKANLRFVMFVLKEFTIPSSISIMDIIQEGNLGLMVGIRRFKHDKHPSIKLFSYVVHWIRFFIRSALIKNNKYEKNRASLITDEDVETTSRASIKDTDDYRNFMHTTDIDATEHIVKEDIEEFLCEVLPNERERMIVKLYYGLGRDGQKNTLEEIGFRLHIKFVRVRQLRDRAIDKIREAVENKMLDSYF